MKALFKTKAYLTRVLNREAEKHYPYEKTRPVQVVKSPTGGVIYTDIHGETETIGPNQLKAARKVVARGVKLLDEKTPGWVEAIVPEALQLSSCQICVCGQLGFAINAPKVQRKIREGQDPFGAMIQFLGITDEDGEYETRHITPSLFGFDKGSTTIQVEGQTRRVEYNYPALEVEWNRVVTRRLAKLEASA